ncbi:hypothetical protein CYLTODRAFT_424385 [Cylindrobasidium torrendii FP15055 ss-10]|uniref:Vacuolar import and degradation protein 21 n=1 Tax=Cylindrobasidium torrendii FP15055 ss-10 TaxID=1314674 RepID=A0A0D7B4H3_9AGAR|nr:hypothetical protein CYLTODRAFT_424385 [Cylindrobasidium torrendii FP15055 ss-10]
MLPEELDALVEERVSQLQEITKRRHETLKEMFSMIKRRENIGNVLSLDTQEEGGPELEEFLKTHDLTQNPETGSVSNLQASSLFARPPARDEAQEDEEGSDDEKGKDNTVKGSSQDVQMADVKIEVPPAEVPPQKKEEEEEEEPTMQVDPPPGAPSSLTVPPPPTQPNTTVVPNAAPAPAPTEHIPPEAATARPSDMSAPPPPQPTPKPAIAVLRRPDFNPNYTLPPLKSLPAEFNRKKKKKIKDKEDERKKESKKDKDEWTGLGLNRWGFTITANPVFKRVSKATKCLTTKDWTVAMTELRLARTIERIETLKDSGKWSFRQPKKQRNVEMISKTHWDYLMDEMKWMRTDFREERRWKLAVAYGLGTSVLEWHAVGTMAERVALGICVKWRRPSEEPPPVEMEMGQDDMEVDEGAPSPEKHQPSNMLLLEYNSDDDDEQDRESVADALDAGGAAEDILDDMEKAHSTEENSRMSGQPIKLEEVDEDMHVDQPVTSQRNSTASSAQATPGPKGVKSGSINPVLSTKSHTPGDGTVPASKSQRVNMYAPVRDNVMFSEPDKLFVDLDDFKISAPEMKEITLPPLELPDLFPDLALLSLYDPPDEDDPPVVSDSKKAKKEAKEREAQTTRMDELTSSRIFPVGKFMHTRPTLLSALNPAKRWQDGDWLPWDDAPVQPAESVDRKVLDESSSDLFSRVPIQVRDTPHPVPTAGRRELTWTQADDELLRGLIERYGTMDRERGTNWKLVTDIFNSSRITVSTDRRLPIDCMLRWREKLALEAPADASGSISAPGSPVLTRKRLATNVPTLTITTEMEPKYKRHKTVHEGIRKMTKKRADNVTKPGARQSNGAVHETHQALISRLPVKTPQEILKAKFERDERERALQRAQAQQAQAAQAAQMAAQAQAVAAAAAARQAPAAAGQQQTATAQPGVNGAAPSDPSQNVQQQASVAPTPAAPTQAQPKPVLPAQQVRVQLPSQVPAQAIPSQTAGPGQPAQQRIATPLVNAARQATPASSSAGASQHLRQQQQHAQQAQATMTQLAQGSTANMSPQDIQLMLRVYNQRTEYAQTQALAATSRPGSAQPRAQNQQGHYYLPHVQNTNQAHFTQEQLLTYQRMLTSQHPQAYQQAQQQQVAQPVVQQQQQQAQPPQGQPGQQ